MARFLLRITVFFMLQAGLAWLVFPPAFSQPRPGYLAALEDKLALLEEDGPPRVIFTGGSSTAFGINSQVFQEALDQKPVNLGLHAAMGMDLYLRIVEQHARPGDLIVLLPEYALLSDRLEMPSSDIRRLLRNCPSAWRYLGGNLRGVKQFLDTMALSEAAYWVQKGTRIQRSQLKQLKRRFRSRRGRSAEQVAAHRRLPHPANENSIYQRANFNQFGDMVGHHGLPSPTDHQPSNGVAFDEEQLMKSIERLNVCADRCRRQGADVIFSYPPIVDQNLVRCRNRIHQMQQILEQALRMPIVNRPEDVAFPLTQFFDTDLHLTEAGQYERSRILLHGLSRELAARRQTDAKWR